ncbi:ABC transporter substrate-binding protein [Desulfoscipio gibsoniae]|uniref:ABC-type nitrate/sulfonate/bicarbonate transport system, periplasmic component n=1 Tax=Desulfoscipio gibsoniae DSM 7213 TaxID=767817 RepID=R4KB48_9FIRM|nr:ABC transporter substrate-binding protein [Desulfoscipio gibsoniae]AGL00403.1 ABC-type nitrate/sulfonate/bicarbonate transport system, periplasmic component [Desulfoscipio gibsoniae DSM 7213]
MIKKLVILVIFSACLLILGGCNQAPATQDTGVNLNVAVEYTDHAAAFYFAQGKGLFEDAGFSVEDVNVYASGVGVAAAFTKGGFDVSYMCLVPAIYTYANGGVPIKIISGTHKDGYGLVVNASKIKDLRDLEKDDIKIANGPKGTTTDFIQMLLLEKENLNAKKVLANTVRMNGAKQLMALRNGQVDAVFVPEHFAAMAASFPGMKMLASSRDICPDMQGSVMVVTEDFLEKHPEAVENLKEINKKSIDLINTYPQEAALIIAQNLNINQSKVKEETKSPQANLEVTPELVAKSMTNLRSTPEISQQDVQTIINKMHALGYITKSFDAGEIMSVN